ncbi:MAG: hypothetical protein ACJAY5_000684 [Actinomycetes bacterium]
MAAEEAGVAALALLLLAEVFACAFPVFATAAAEEAPAGVAALVLAFAPLASASASSSGRLDANEEAKRTSDPA